MPVDLLRRRNSSKSCFLIQQEVSKIAEQFLNSALPFLSHELLCQTVPAHILLSIRNSDYPVCKCEKKLLFKPVVICFFFTGFSCRGSQLVLVYWPIKRPRLSWQWLMMIVMARLEQMVMITEHGLKLFCCSLYCIVVLYSIVVVTSNKCLVNFCQSMQACMQSCGLSKDYWK